MSVTMIRTLPSDYFISHAPAANEMTLKNPVSVVRQSAKNDPNRTVPAGTPVYLYADYEYPLAPKTTVPIQLQTSLDGKTWTTKETQKANSPGPGEAIFRYQADASTQYRFVTPESAYITGKTSEVLGLTVTGTLPPPPPPVTQVPSAPPASISSVTEKTISIDWSPPVQPNGTITAYQFGWTTPSGKPRYSWQLDYPIGDPRISDPFTLINLEPATEYTLWVAAKNAAGLSAKTQFTVTTKGTPPPPTCDPAYPDFCIPPPPPDKNCTDFAQKNFKALAPDPHGLDEDKDGIACEAAVTPPVTPPVVTPPAPPAPPVVTPPPAAPAPAVTVVTKAVSKGGKLWVDVNPNRKGTGYYKFRVQKWNGETWVNKKVYRTKGKKETRTINLGKGSYRVVVAGKYGLLGAVSDAVYLKK